MARIMAESAPEWVKPTLWHYLDMYRKWVPLSSRQAYDREAVNIIKERL